MLGTDYILDALAAEGVDHLFMVPGGLVDPFLPALGRQTALRPIVAAQEGGAAYMADGYARASGNVGAVLCIGGPGLGNTVTPVAAARTDGSPCVRADRRGGDGDRRTRLVPGREQPDPRRRGGDEAAGALHEFVDNPRNLNHLFRRALIEMRTPPMAPVHLSIPRDVQTADIGVRHARIDPAIVHPALLALDAAEASLALFTDAGGTPPVKVAVLAGAGVEHGNGAASLRQFAEAFDIPVATTLRAKGVFPGGPPAVAGCLRVRRHASCANRTLRRAAGSPARAGVGARRAGHAALVAGASAAAHDRRECIDAGDRPEHDRLRRRRRRPRVRRLAAAPARPPGRAAAVDARGAPGVARGDPRAAAAAGSGTPDERRAADPSGRIVADLRAAFPRDGILLVDSGAHRAFAGHYWSAYAPRTYISATNLGPMGWAIPAAVGVACAQPARKVAVITGDGCMHMHGLEVATAARYALPIVYVVINNAALGNVWLRAHTEGPVPDALTSLPDIDWAAFGSSLGCDGERARSRRSRAGVRARVGVQAPDRHRREGRQALHDTGRRLVGRERGVVVSRVAGATDGEPSLRSRRARRADRALYDAMVAQRAAQGGRRSPGPILR